jgi:hypothetical protein
MDKNYFKALVGKKFFLSMDGSKVELELIELREMPPRRVPGLRTEPFGLLFRGPLVSCHTEALPRQVHRAQAPDGEVFDIYLEPIVSTGESGMLYEAIYD